MLNSVSGLVLMLMVMGSAAASGQSPMPSDAAPLRDRQPPIIRHLPVQRAQPGRRIEIDARIEDEGGIAFPRLYYRSTGDSEYQVVRMKTEGARVTATIPGFAVRYDGVEYYLEVFDQAGNGPTLHAMPERPHRISVTKSQAVAPSTQAVATDAPVAGATPWYARWWVWAIGGAVVAGVATAIAVGVATGEDDGSLTTLRVRAPMPRPPLEQAP
jgi:glycosidase